MLNRGAATVISFLFITNLLAQSPAPSGAPTAKTPASKSVTPSVSPTPSPTPGTQEIINSLNEGDLQATISLLKNNFPNPEAITDRNRIESRDTNRAARANARRVIAFAKP